eukprot:CAMPEP_0183377428 /NCGR_PEP_ID=MMETSP0164_2-20130417/122998_1 /TAXON_ID=221442 /ORGANISM="Coccolithus pelagicus ssp braarudi, Strain PLY182g" /LENGTH=86 /DNA_ID=CAMNT_0025554877 /DNA_START=29 /DNA_END=288 /DNA_ORIENTATION=+
MTTISFCAFPLRLLMRQMPVEGAASEAVAAATAASALLEGFGCALAVLDTDFVEEQQQQEEQQQKQREESVWLAGREDEPWTPCGA